MAIPTQEVSSALDRYSQRGVRESTGQFDRVKPSIDTGLYTTTVPTGLSSSVGCPHVSGS